MHTFLRKWRLAMVFSSDIFMVIFALFATFSLSYNFSPLPVRVFSYLPYFLMLQGISFYFCGLYRGIWRFASIPDLIRILQAVLVGTIALAIILNFYTDEILSFHSIPIMYAVFLILLLSGPRVLFRWLKDKRRFFNSSQRILIVGAGSAGESVVRDLIRFSHGLEPVAFVDDNPTLLGKEIHGIRVKGACSDIPMLVADLKIQLIIVAMPSASSADMRRIVSFCERTSIPFRTLPGLKELTEGRVNINALREVSLEDLLGRQQVALAWDKINATFAEKAVLVTGGGGSIGEELCVQVASLSPKKLILIENCEYNLYLIEMKLRNRFPKLELYCVLSSVTDYQAVQSTFAKHRPQLVFHAAAYKHVPLLEAQIRIAIHNNINGTRMVAEAAAAHGAETFVLISTDKAVNPTNIMGATKRASEIFCQNFNFQSNTNFITVRFGNVLDSAGSVVPLFRKQLQEGGPLTVTHPEMTRYFMTIPEACQLILQAASIGNGGEIFVLDMGEPIKIRYLAEQLIRLSGRVLRDEIDIQYIGLRPGEKLHEELFYNEEELSATSHPKIRKAKAQRRNWSSLVALLNELEIACEACQEDKLLMLLNQMVPEYQGNQNQHSNEYLQLAIANN